MNRSVVRLIALLGFIVLVLAALACGPLSTLTGQDDSQATPTSAIMYSTAAVNQTGGTVQWAVEATASSEYGSENWSAQQATGAPNTEGCGDIATAWATANSSGVDWIALQYNQPVIPTRIEIYETFNPGAIVQVDVIDSQSSYFETVYVNNSPSPVDTCPRTLVINVSGVTQPIDSVMIALDQTNNNGWNEIDAVALISQ